MISHGKLRQGQCSAPLAVAEGTLLAPQGQGVGVDDAGGGAEEGMVMTGIGSAPEE